MEPILVGDMQLLRDLVHLRREGRDPVVVRILQVRDAGLVLGAPYDDDGHRDLPAAGTPLKVGCLTEGGTQWLAAVSAGEEPGDRPAFAVRFLDRAVHQERRRRPRAKVSFPLDVAAGIGDSTVRGSVLDVGEGGMRARVPIELGIGDMVHLTVHVHSGEPIRLTASVIRAETGDVYAFGYGLFASGSRDLLVEQAFRASASHAA